MWSVRSWLSLGTHEGLGTRATKDFHIVKVNFISVRIRDVGRGCPYLQSHELTTPPRRPAISSPAKPAEYRSELSPLSQPGPFEALDQGNHAVVPWRGNAYPPPFGRDTAVEDVDLGGPAREDVLQHARLVVIRLGDGFVHGLPLAGA